ncbi:MAG: hypothetical protein LBT15_07925, partial [Synergistaceae bacterium]|nr:hypothetical protein [Synergistaceae bacterium]
MQSTFSTPVAVTPSGEGRMGGARKTAGGIKSEGTQDAEGAFTPFLSLFSQAMQTAQTEPPESDGDGDLSPAAFFTSQEAGAGDEAGVEQTASLLNGMNDNLLFSKSILDLVVSVKSGLEEKGVDVTELSRQVGEVLGEVLPGLDMERLKTMMARLRDRYAASGDAAALSGNASGVREGGDASV